MNKFLKVLAGTVLALSLSSFAFAQAAGPQKGGLQQQGNKTGGQQKKGNQNQNQKKRGPIGKKLVQELNLTAEQQKRVEALTKKFMESAPKTDGAAKGDRKAMRARREAFMKELNAILTPEQQAKLKKLQEEAKKKRDGGGGAAPTKKGDGGF